MSLSHFDSPNIQKFWTNETFDGSDGSSNGKNAGLSVLQPISTNRLNSSNHDSCKENRSGSVIPKKFPIKKVKELDESGLDEEMDMIEREIKRLTFRLEELKLKKASLVQKKGKIVPSKFMEPKPFFTPNKCSTLQFGTPESYKSRQTGASLGPLEIQNSCKSAKKPNLKKIEEIKEEQDEENKVPNQNDKSRRRGLSLGPLEIQNGCKSAKKPSLNKLEEIKEEQEEDKKLQNQNDKSRRRGLSLGPLEIQNGCKSAKKTNLKKLEVIKEEEKKVPYQNDKSTRRGLSLGPLEIQNGCKSAKKPNFKKLQEIKEETKDPKLNNLRSKRGVSLGPLEISTITKTPSKYQTKILKTEKKEATSSTSKPSFGKPKPLFDEFSNNSVPNRRLSKGSRVVPSRYSLAPVKVNLRGEPNSKRRKWSLPGEEREGDFDSIAINESSPQSVTKIAVKFLPRIKAVRINVESPRDSGRAKRVMELEGKKPFFCRDGVSSYKDRAFL